MHPLPFPIKFITPKFQTGLEYFVGFGVTGVAATAGWLEASGVGVTDLSLSFEIEKPKVTVFPDEAGTTFTRDGEAADALVLGLTAPLSAVAKAVRMGHYED